MKYITHFAIPSIVIAVTVFIFITQLKIPVKSELSTKNDTQNNNITPHIKNDNKSVARNNTFWSGYRILYFDKDTNYSVASKILKDNGVTSYICRENQDIPLAISKNSLEYSLAQYSSPCDEYITLRDGYFFDKDKRFEIFYISDIYDTSILKNILDSFNTLGIKAGAENIIKDNSLDLNKSNKLNVNALIKNIFHYNGNNSNIDSDVTFNNIMQVLPYILYFLAPFMTAIFALFFLFLTVKSSLSLLLSSLVTYSIPTLFAFASSATLSSLSAVFLIYVSFIILRLQKFAASSSQAAALEILLKSKRVAIFTILSFLVVIFLGIKCILLYLLCLAALISVFVLIKSLTKLSSEDKFNFVKILLPNTSLIKRHDRLSLFLMGFVCAIILLVAVAKLLLGYAEPDTKIFKYLETKLLKNTITNIQYTLSPFKNNKNEQKELYEDFPSVPCAKFLLSGEGEQINNVLPTIDDYVRYRYRMLATPYKRLDSPNNIIHLGDNIQYLRYAVINNKITEHVQYFIFDNEFIKDSLSSIKKLNENSIEHMLLKNYSPLKKVTYYK